MVQGKSPTAAVGESPPDGGSDREQAIVAGRQFHVHGSVFCGRRTSHIDDAGQGAGTIKRALRPAQYFNLLNIVQAGDAADSRKVDVIDDEADGWVGCAFVLFPLTDTPQLKIACP